MNELYSGTISFSIMSLLVLLYFPFTLCNGRYGYSVSISIIHNYNIVI